MKTELHALSWRCVKDSGCLQHAMTKSGLLLNTSVDMHQNLTVRSVPLVEAEPRSYTLQAATSHWIHVVIFLVHTPVLLKIHIFWDIKPYRLVVFE